MNSGINLHNEVPKCAWVVLIAAVLMLLTAVWWASAQGTRNDRNKIDAGDNPTPAPAPANLYSQPPQAVPPMPEPDPAYDNPPQRPKVTITPSPTGPPVSLVWHGAQNNGKQAGKKRGLGDMFPFGKILPGSTANNPPGIVDRQPSRPAPADAQPRILETFPGFEYGGGKWAFTGSYADGRQLQLSSEYMKLAGRSVRGLADVNGNISLLFVQSGLDPNRWAIYRQGN